VTGQSSDTRKARERARTCTECGTESSPDQSFCDGCGAVLGWGPGVEGSVASEDAPASGSDSGSGSGDAADDWPGTARHGSRDAADDWPGTARPGSLNAAGPDDGPGAGAPAGEPGRSAAAADAAAVWGTSGAPANRSDTDTVPRMGARSAVAPGAEPAPADQPSAGAADGSADRPRPSAAPGPQDPGAAFDPHGVAAAERARALLVPVADPQRRAPATSSIAPVLPGRPVAARPVVRAPGLAPDEDGSEACPWCGTGNRQDRHFCRRCAMTLAGRPQDPAQRPWWRRLLDFRRRPAPWAGDRPRLRWGIGRIGTWVVAAGAAALVVFGALNVGSAVQATRDHFAKRAPIAPDSVAASHSYKGHGPRLAFDEFSNTWWGPGISESGAGEWLEARFLQPTRLLNVVITPGVSSQPTDLSKSADPHRIEVRITTSKGTTSTREVTLDQGSGGQALSFRASDVTSVRFTIRSSYGVAPSKQVAIAEVEFFGRAHSGT
jgi:hypothetical protein